MKSRPSYLIKMPKFDNLTLCRLCKNSKDTYINIFNSKLMNGVPVWEVIHEITQFEVNKEDGLPENICTYCMEKVSEFKVFKTMCINSRTDLLGTSAERQFSFPLKMEEIDISDPPVEPSETEPEVETPDYVPVQSDRLEAIQNNLEFPLKMEEIDISDPPVEPSETEPEVETPDYVPVQSDRLEAIQNNLEFPLKMEEIDISDPPVEPSETEPEVETPDYVPVQSDRLEAIQNNLEFPLKMEEIDISDPPVEPSETEPEVETPDYVPVQSDRMEAIQNNLEFPLKMEEIDISDPPVEPSETEPEVETPDYVPVQSDRLEAIQNNLEFPLKMEEIDISDPPVEPSETEPEVETPDYVPVQSDRMEAIQNNLEFPLKMEEIDISDPPVEPSETEPEVETPDYVPVQSDRLEAIQNNLEFPLKMEEIDISDPPVEPSETEPEVETPDYVPVQSDRMEAIQNNLEFPLKMEEIDISDPPVEPSETEPEVETPDYVPVQSDRMEAIQNNLEFSIKMEERETSGPPMEGSEAGNGAEISPHSLVKIKVVQNTFKVAHDLSPLTYICHKCERSFKNKRGLSIHMKAKHNMVKFTDLRADMEEENYTSGVSVKGLGERESGHKNCHLQNDHLLNRSHQAIENYASCLNYIPSSSDSDWNMSKWKLKDCSVVLHDICEKVNTDLDSEHSAQKETVVSSQNPSELEGSLPVKSDKFLHDKSSLTSTKKILIEVIPINCKPIHSQESSSQDVNAKTGLVNCGWSQSLVPVKSDKFLHDKSSLTATKKILTEVIPINCKPIHRQEPSSKDVNAKTGLVNCGWQRSLDGQTALTHHIIEGEKVVGYFNIPNFSKPSQDDYATVPKEVNIRPFWWMDDLQSGPSNNAVESATQPLKFMGQKSPQKVHEPVQNQATQPLKFIGQKSQQKLHEPVQNQATQPLKFMGHKSLQKLHEPVQNQARKNVKIWQFYKWRGKMIKRRKEEQAREKELRRQRGEIEPCRPANDGGSSSHEGASSRQGQSPVSPNLGPNSHAELIKERLHQHDTDKTSSIILNTKSPQQSAENQGKKKVKMWKIYRRHSILRRIMREKKAREEELERHQEMMKRCRDSMNMENSSLECSTSQQEQKLMMRNSYGPNAISN